MYNACYWPPSLSTGSIIPALHIISPPGVFQIVFNVTFSVTRRVGRVHTLEHNEDFMFPYTEP